MNLDYSDYIEVETNVTDGPANTLIDSQADVCVLKESSLNGNYTLNSDDIISITGVVDKPIFSLGSIYVELNFQGTIISQKFYVMPNDFCIPCDGIIGKDFIKAYKCVMDYGEETFSIKLEDEHHCPVSNIVIPMNLFTRDNTLVIPPRCEVTKIFKFTSRLPLFIKAKELKKGVMSGNSIARDGKAMISIVNTTDRV